MSLHVLLIEEIGLISSEILATMDLILQKLRQNKLFFGGFFVIGNGDTNQLPNIDGSDIFLSTIVLFIFDTHFLTTLVRMLDPIGQRLLQLMTQRPIPQAGITTIVEIVRQNCSFANSWDDLSDASIMKVFGRREAEIEAMNRHQLSIPASGDPFCENNADDEICHNSSINWVPANDDASNSSILNVENHKVLSFRLSQLFD